MRSRSSYKRDKPQCVWRSGEITAPHRAFTDRPLYLISNTDTDVYLSQMLICDTMWSYELHVPETHPQHSEGNSREHILMHLVGNSCGSSNT